MAIDPLNNQRNSPLDYGGETPSYFISYAHVDHENVEKIRREIQKGPQRFHVWFDQRNLPAGSPIDSTIQKAIDTCNAILFVATNNSVRSEYCQAEIARGLKKKKTIVSLCLDPDVDLPMRLDVLKYIDFSSSFEGGLKELCRFLAQARQESPSTPVTNESVGIAEPSLPVPAYFLGRSKEQQDIEEFVSSDASTMLWINGRAGSGKTALACHVLDQIRCGKWVDSGRKVPIHTVAYLDWKHHSRRDWFNLLNRVRSLSGAMPHEPLLGSHKSYLVSVIENILSGLSERRIVLLVDHLDDLIDLDTRNLTNPNLRAALQGVLTCTTHKLKVIVTSRVLPTNLPTVQSGRLCSLNLGEGLPAAEAMQFLKQLLKQLDRDGTSGLQAIDHKLLAELCRRTQGNPRAIETLHAIVQEDQDTSLKDILEQEQDFLPRPVLDNLIGESYACLDDVSKTMMQVLSVSEVPITVEAVATVFHHYHPDIDARKVLSRLVNMQLIQKANQCYRLREGDWGYVAPQLVDGVSSTMGGPEGVHLGRFTLYKHYADYFKQAASASDPTTESELLTQAFQHSYKGKQYEAAVDVLKRLEPHLFEQGRYLEMAQYYEQLAGKLEHHKLVRRRLDRLAWIYQRLGKLNRAAAYYEEGLKCVRDERDQNGQCLYLANLAICKQESGDLVGTTLYCMTALELARETGDGVAEAHIWNIIGDSLACLGQISAAMQANERALKLARDNYQREIEVVARVNLGQHYEAIGDDNRAQEECDRACRMVFGIRYQLGESAARRNLGILQLNRRRYRLAAEDLTKAMQLADATQSVQLQQTIRIELASAFLLGGELTKAEATVGEALQYYTPLFSPEAYALNGVILQQQGKVYEATKSFSHALEQAQVVLKRTSGYYRVLDTMGLSYIGLMLTEKEPYLDEAIEAYQASRLLTHEPGIVRRRLLLFDALAQADPEKNLVLVRNAITSPTP